VQSLANYGFAAKRCRESAVACGFQKSPALLMLCQELLEGVFDAEGLEEDEESLAAVEEDIMEARNDEAMALEAIFPEDFTVIPPDSPEMSYTTWRLRIPPPEGTLALVREEMEGARALCSYGSQCKRLKDPAHKVRENSYKIFESSVLVPQRRPCL
jgi:hypothetical protein